MSDLTPAQVLAMRGNRHGDDMVAAHNESSLRALCRKGLCTPAYGSVGRITEEGRRVRDAIRAAKPQPSA